jgi:hypothetical protein
MNTSIIREFFDSPPSEQQLATLTNNILKIKDDIDNLKISITDSLIVGDNLFDTTAHSGVVSHAKERINELKAKEKELKNNIGKKSALIRRFNRDFTDVKQSLPDTLPNKKIHVIEDYTISLLVISFLFMLISFIYAYTITSEDRLYGFSKSLLYSFLISIFFIVIVYYVA